MTKLKELLRKRSKLNENKKNKKFKDLNGKGRKLGGLC
jgi:hypothetical protein